MKYIAKPYLNKNVGMKEFDNVEDAVRYLETYTGFKMSSGYNKKTKIRTYDWQLIGKLILIDNAT